MPTLNHRRLLAPISLCLAALACPLAPLRAQPAASADGPRFDILEFVVEGDTVLGTAAIERAVYPFMGPQRSAADAEAARKALEKAYQDAGFLSVNVVLPPQRVDGAGGELRLQVVAAAVAKLRVSGASYTLPSAIRAALPSLAPGNVPNFPEMQQELAQLARASADREITPIIAAGDQPGSMNVELKVQDSLPLHGALELNNKQSANTQAGRLEAGLSYDNLFQRGHSLGLNWLYSPRRPEEANIQSLVYHLPLGGAGDRLFLMLVHSNSNTPTALGGATVSRGDTWRLRWRDELDAPTGLGGDGAISQALTWGLTLRDLQDRNRDVAGFNTAAPTLRYPSFNASYELDLGASQQAALPGRSTRLQVDLNWTVSGLSRRMVDCYGSTKDQFDCKRSGASAGFQVLGLTLQHREPLGRWALNAKLQGQLASGALAPAEQLVYGGQDSVRGFYEGEHAGDAGAALRLELSAPAWPLLDQLALRGLGFVDLAQLQRLDPLPGEVTSSRLGSAGLGLRAETSFGLQASLVWSRLLLGGSAGNAAPGVTRSHSQRWDFNLKQAF